MKKKFSFICLNAVALICLPCKAQHYFYNNTYYEKEFLFEVGVSAGMMNCLTDLGGKKGVGKKFIKDLNLKNSKLSYSLYAAGVYKNFIGLRAEGTFGLVTAYDSILKGVKATTFGRYERNLSFKSNITDVQLAFEIYPFFGAWAQEHPPLLSPYIIGGIGFFSFNPQAMLNGKWYSLQPLSTEGQGFAEYGNTKPYSLRQINIPLGAGIKYELSALINLRFEICYRILRTDYLDDVSTVYADPSLFAAYLPAGYATVALLLADRQGELNSSHNTIPGGQRGNSKDNDAFFTTQVKLGFIINRKKIKATYK